MSLMNLLGLVGTVCTKLKSLNIETCEVSLLNRDDLDGMEPIPTTSRITHLSLKHSKGCINITNLLLTLEKMCTELETLTLTGSDTEMPQHSEIEHLIRFKLPTIKESHVPLMSLVMVLCPSVRKVILSDDRHVKIPPIPDDAHKSLTSSQILEAFSLSDTAVAFSDQLALANIYYPTVERFVFEKVASGSAVDLKDNLFSTSETTSSDQSHFQEPLSLLKDLELEGIQFTIPLIQALSFVADRCTHLQRLTINGCDIDTSSDGLVEQTDAMFEAYGSSHQWFFVKFVR